MVLVECANRVAADALIATVCDHHPFHLEMSPRITIQSSITLTQYQQTTHYVAIGVFYQSPVIDPTTTKRIGPSSFDFWGFVCGNVLRSNCNGSDTITIKREWCSMKIERCHSSFDAYQHAFDEGVMCFDFNLDQFEFAISARIHLYHYVSGRYDTTRFDVPLVVGSRVYNLLHLVDAQAVMIDLLGYRSVLMYVACKKHGMINRPANNAFKQAWHLAEERLFTYRLNRFTHDDTEMMIQHIDTDRKIEKVECGMEYARILGKHDAVDGYDAAYAQSLRAFLPVNQHRYRAPFEMATSLVATRSILIHGGFVYMTESNLYPVLLSASRSIHTRNMQISVDAKSEGWTHDERTRYVYRCCFLEAYTKVISHYGFSLSKRDVIQSDSPQADPLHELRLESVLNGSPPCMTALMDRAMNLKVAAHNKYENRGDTIQYLMRMGIPTHIVRPRIRAKVEISYASSSVRSEWRSIDAGIKWQKEYLAKKRTESNVFVPHCKWIIETNGQSTSIICPYASKMLLDSASARVWQPNELSDGAKCKCNAKWQKDAGAVSKYSYAANTPDEYTNRMIAHRSGVKFAAPVIKRKS